MKIKDLIDEDFVNYRKPSMFIGTCKCDFKCFKEKGLPVDQCINFKLREQRTKDIPNDEIVERYLMNPYTEAIVIGGMEPFLQMTEVIELIKEFRKKTNDDIVIYTGYYKDEVEIDLKVLRNFKNIIIKFGRYLPEGQEHFDDVLGVYLISENQYAERIS